MRGLLKVTAIGNLGAMPTISTMPSGDNVANFNLAVSDGYKKPNGEWVERTEWLKCHAFGDIANVIERLCQKNTQVHIEAGFKSTKWVGNNNVHHKGFELRIQNIIVLNGGKAKDENDNTQNPGSKSNNATGGFIDG